jgi:uncharacterized membrane protein
MNWAHVHLLVNHLPVVGSVFALGLLVYTMARGSDELRRVCLGLFVIVGVAAGVAFLTGTLAEDEVRGLPGVTQDLIEEHEEAAIPALGLALAVGVVALVGLLKVRPPRELSRPLLVAVLVLGLATVGLMALAANAGGRIRHTEIRPAAERPAA